MLKFKILTMTMFAFLSVQSVQAESGQIRFIQVLDDENVVIEGGPYIDHYWIETDGTQGIIYLTFPEIENSSVKFRSISLIINIPDIKDSGSNTGLEIIYDEQVIGQLARGSANSWIEIPLNNINLKKGKIKLTIKPKGMDGMAICSKASGFGPLLKIVY